MTRKKAINRKIIPINKKEDMENLPETEKINANKNIKDGGKKSSEEIDEIKSDGSGGAFEGTEEVKE